MNEIVTAVEGTFERLNLQKIKKFLDYRTLGNLDNANILICGEKYGDKLLPPLVPFGNNYPGLLLFKALDQIRLEDKWNKMLLTNAVKWHDKSYENDLALLDEIALPKIDTILCLGSKAYEAVNKTLLTRVPPFVGKVLKTFHPSYCARKGMTAEQYAEEISKVLQL